MKIVSKILMLLLLVTGCTPYIYLTPSQKTITRNKLYVEELAKDIIEYKEKNGYFPSQGFFYKKPLPKLSNLSYSPSKESISFTSKRTGVTLVCVDCLNRISIYLHTYNLNTKTWTVEEGVI